MLASPQGGGGWQRGGERTPENRKQKKVLLTGLLSNFNPTSSQSEGFSSCIFLGPKLQTKKHESNDKVLKTAF